MPELPGCPFCGSQRVELLPNFGNRVVCNDCTAEAHIDDWRKRVISSRLLTKMSLADNSEAAYEILLGSGYTILMDYGDSNEQDTQKP